MAAARFFAFTLALSSAGAFAPPTRALPSSRVLTHQPRAAIRLAEDKEGGGFLGQLGGKIARLFKPDEQKAAIVKRQQEVDRSVDAMLQGTGLLGAMLAPMMKGIGGALAEAVAQQGDDIEAVLNAVDRVLQRDMRVSSALGGQVGAGSPLGQSYSSMSINGVTRKMINLLIPVSGARGTGSARVQASIDGSGTVRDLVVRFSAPGIGEIDLSGGSQYGAPGDSDVIDADVIDV
jgi:hypothetical protein